MNDRPDLKITQPDDDGKAAYEEAKAVAHGGTVVKPNDPFPLLIKSPADVFNTLEIMRAMKTDDHPNIAALSEMASFIREILLGSSKPINWEHFYATHGKLTMELMGSQFNEVDFVTLLHDKHRRYGTESILSWGHVGVLCRIDQKWARMRQLTSGKIAKDDHGDESIQDTLTDIIGYSVIGIRICAFGAGNIKYATTGEDNEESN